MRIVLDTNVVMSALLWRGTPYRLLAAIQQRPSVQLFSSAALLSELADVLTRPSAIKRLALINQAAVNVIADYVEVIELVAFDEGIDELHDLAPLLCPSSAPCEPPDPTISPTA